MVLEKYEIRRFRMHATMLFSECYKVSIGLCDNVSASMDKVSEWIRCNTDI